MSTVSHDRQGEEKKGRPRNRIVPWLILLLVIAISVGLFFFAQRYPDKVRELGNYGYLGVFVVSLISNATVILPVPGILVVFPLVATLNPVLLGLVGATAGTIGETTGYMVGYSGRGVVQRGRTYDRVEGWMKRWGGWTVFVFAVAPFLLVDIAGVVAGALRFPLWKFLLIVWAGKSIKYVALTFAAVWGWEAVLRYIG
jgi:membrane protein YqaA with SNARE-associated domain